MTTRPVISRPLPSLATAALRGLTVSWPAARPEFALYTLGYCVAIAMGLPGLQKLQAVESFSTMFVNYDLLSQGQVRYDYFYRFAETVAGILTLAGVLIRVAAPLCVSGLHPIIPPGEPFCRTPVTGRGWASGTAQRTDGPAER